ncbi:MAG: hypothetical protein AAF717_00495 [Bacteroidota bacterium]
MRKTCALAMGAGLGTSMEWTYLLESISPKWIPCSYNKKPLYQFDAKRYFDKMEIMGIARAAAKDIAYNLKKRKGLSGDNVRTSHHSVDGLYKET